MSELMKARQRSADDLWTNCVHLFEAMREASRQTGYTDIRPVRTDFMRSLDQLLVLLRGIEDIYRDA